MKVLYGEHFCNELELRSVCYESSFFIVSDDYYTLRMLETDGIICQVRNWEKILLVRKEPDDTVEYGEYYSILRVYINTNHISVSGVMLDGTTNSFLIDPASMIKVIHRKEGV